MNNIDTFRESALGFVETASKSVTQSDIESEENLDSLINEVANATQILNQGNIVQTCSSTVTKATKAVDLARWLIRSNDLVKLNDSLTDLTCIAISTVRQDLLGREGDESWLLDFLNMDNHIIAGLMEDSVFIERLTQAVLTANPNLLIKPEQEINLLIDLVHHKHPKLHELALKLLDHPALDLHHQTKNGFTVLHVAAMQDNAKLIEALVAKGADPLRANKGGEIPFDVCSGWESARAILNAVGFETEIGIEKFVDKVVKQVPQSYYICNAIDMENLVAYLKVHSLSSDTLATLNKALGEVVGEGGGLYFISKLLEKGYILEGLSDEALGRVAHYLCISEKPKALRTLLRAQYLPIIPHNEEDLFTEIEQRETLSKELKGDIENCKNAMGEAALQAYLTLSRDLGHVHMHIHRALKMEEIDRGFKTLIDLKFKGAAAAKVQFDALESTIAERKFLSQAQAIIKKDTTPENKVQEAVGAGREVFQVLRSLAWLEKDVALLGEIGRLSIWFDGKLHHKGETGVVDKIVANVALDKAFYKDKETYEIGDHFWVAPYLSNALTTARTRIEEGLTTIQEATVKKSLQIVDQCRRELLQLVRWADSIGFSIELGMDYKFSNRTRCEALIETINCLSPGESCLIPVTVPGHGTLIRVERGAQNKYRLFMYNTGQGVDKHHAKGKRERTYQTYREYSKVPLEDLQNTQNWTDLIEVFSETVRSMDDVYALLDKMCERGVKEPPSKSNEHYEAVQSSGSCVYMCFLAMIRERFVSSLADPAEGLGLYKYVKAELLNGLEERTRALRSEKINELFQAKLRLMGSEIALAQALSDPQIRYEIVSSLRDSLSRNHLDARADVLQLAETMTPLGLFAFTHRAIRKISESKYPSADNELLQEAILARRARRLQNEQGYLEILDEFYDNPTHSNMENWAKTIGFQLLGGPMQSTSLDWIVKRLTTPPTNEEDDSASTRFLLRLVQGIKRQSENIRENLLELLIQRYQANENSEMVDYLNTAFRPEPTQQPEASEFEY